jgi:hypothetical protein
MDSAHLLATLDSDHADERIQVVLNRRPDGASTVSLVQQSWAESLGWYTQKAMDLSPEQVRQLRSALGTPTAGKVTTHISPDRPAVSIPHPVCVPFVTPTRRAHSA